MNVGPQPRSPRIVSTLPASGVAGDFIYVSATSNSYIADNAGTYQIIDVGTGDGDVVGPASAVSGHLAVFSGTTGKLIADGGAIPGGISGLTTNTLPKATSATTLGDSRISDDGTSILVGQSAAVGHTYLNLDTSSPGIDIQAGTDGLLTLQDATRANNIVVGAGAVNITSSSAISIDSGTGTTTIGDVGGASNNTTLTASDADQTVAVAAANGFLLNGHSLGTVLAIPVNNTVLPTSTVFSSPGNVGTPLSVTTEGNVSWPCPRAGVLGKLRVRTGSTAKTNTPTTVITVRVNGVDSALTLTLTETINTTSSDLAHTASVAAGDLITVKFVVSGAAAISTSMAGISMLLD